MLPRDLKPESFAGYPPGGRRVLVAHLDMLRNLPLTFLPSLLREAVEYDYRFPVEQRAIERELDHLSSLTQAQMDDWFEAFAKITLSPSFAKSDWINEPAQFVERQSAYLWSTHQLDAFRTAATDYGARLLAAAPTDPPPMRRLGIAVIGQGVASYEGVLFKNLRKHGTYFSGIDPANGLEVLRAHLEHRANQHPEPYAHWYVDGASGFDAPSHVTCVSYEGLAPVRAALLKRMKDETEMPGMGPEELRTHMAQLLPADLGMSDAGDPVLSRFQLKLLTEGSGTQIYSTTFVQWTAREVLRRAQALTLMVRFAPRQRQRPMNELLADTRGGAQVDAPGSLVDADMAAYYHWINQQRLAGSEHSSFLVWFEGHEQAMVVSPSLPRGAESKSAMNLQQLLTVALT